LAEHAPAAEGHLEMACFITPMALATVTTVLRKKVPALRLDRLAIMLWASSVALIVDHAISGELSPYPPFLTALRVPEQTAVMLREILVTGTSMTAAVIGLWALTLAWEKMTARRREDRVASSGDRT